MPFGIHRHVLTDAELQALAAIEELVSDDADYVAVAREKLTLLCQVVRVSGLSARDVAVAHAADKADRLERTVDEFARHNEALRQKGEVMQERFRSLRQELLDARAWVDRLDSLDEARRNGVREGDAGPSQHWRNGYETCQEAILDRLAQVPLVALTDTPVDRYVDLNAMEGRIGVLERDLEEERESRAWLMDRMNALGLALGLRSHLSSPDKLLRQALRLEALALAAEQLLGRLRDGHGPSSEAMARALGLVEASAEIDGLAKELERWRSAPDTMSVEVSGEVSTESDASDSEG